MARVLPSPRMALAVLTGLNLLNYLDRFLPFAVLPALSASLHLSDTRAGLLQTLFMGSYILVSPIAGWLGDRRSRFVCRLHLARLCQEAGKADLALPQLEALDEEARRLGLEEWEPALSGELAQELWKCHTAAAAPEKAREHYVRLCRLNPAAALAADGRK